MKWIVDSGRLKAVEIKAGKTINSYFFKGLTYFHKLVPDVTLKFVYIGNAFQQRSACTTYPMQQINSIIA